MGHAPSARSSKPRLEILTAHPRFLPRLGLTVVLVAAAIAYSGTFGFDFVYDDHEQIVENYRIQAWRFVPSYFAEHVWSHLSPKDPGNFYRPLFLLWLRVNHALFGLKPAGWHLTSVLLHLAVVVLVYSLARKILADDFGAGLAAAIFAFHPVHLEAVAWISGATEPLSAVPLLASFLCFLNWRERPRPAARWLAASWCLYVMGLLIKESALVLPLIILAWEGIRKVGTMRRSQALSRELKPSVFILALAGYVALTAFYLGARWHFLKALSYDRTPLSLRTVILTVPQTLWLYVRHLVYPVGLSEFYDLPYISGFTSRELLIPVAACVVLLLGLWAWSHASLPAADATLWLLVPLLPVLNSRVFPEGDFVHDRYLYLPSVGFSILLALALRHLTLTRREWFGIPASQAVAGAVVVVLLAAATVLESTMWANDVLLSTQGIKVAPKSIYALNNFGNALMAQKDFGHAEPLFRRALELRPNFWEAHYNLGVLNFKIGNDAESENQMKQAIRINPFDAREYLGLGFAVLRRGRAEEGLGLMRHAVELQPEGWAPHASLGLALEAQGDLQGALQELKTALAKDPTQTALHGQITRLEDQIGAKQKSNSREPLSSGAPLGAPRTNVER